MLISACRLVGEAQAGGLRLRRGAWVHIHVWGEIRLSSGSGRTSLVLPWNHELRARPSWSGPYATRFVNPMVSCRPRGPRAEPSSIGLTSHSTATATPLASGVTDRTCTCEGKALEAPQAAQHHPHIY